MHLATSCDWNNMNVEPPGN